MGKDMWVCERMEMSVRTLLPSTTLRLAGGLGWKYIHTIYSLVRSEWTLKALRPVPLPYELNYLCCSDAESSRCVLWKDLLSYPCVIVSAITPDRTFSCNGYLQKYPRREGSYLAWSRRDDMCTCCAAEPGSCCQMWLIYTKLHWIEYWHAVLGVGRAML